MHHAGIAPSTVKHGLASETAPPIGLRERGRPEARKPGFVPSGTCLVRNSLWQPIQAPCSLECRWSFRGRQRLKLPLTIAWYYPKRNTLIIFIFWFRVFNRYRCFISYATLDSPSPSKFPTGLYDDALRNLACALAFQPPNYPSIHPTLLPKFPNDPDLCFPTASSINANWDQNIIFLILPTGVSVFTRIHDRLLINRSTCSAPHPLR